MTSRRNEDMIGGRPDYRHPVEIDKWREAENERKEKVLRDHRVRTTDAARTMEKRLRSKGLIAGPPKRGKS